VCCPGNTQAQLTPIPLLMPAPVVVTLYWPEHGVVQNPLSGWSWREDGGSVSVLVDSKQHPHLPACCTPPEHQPVGVLLPEDEAVTRVSRRRTAAGLGPRESSVWVSLLATDSGLPRLRALWLSGVHEHDTVLVTVLYQVCVSRPELAGRASSGVLDN